MAQTKCPICDCPCIVRIIATEDEKWCQVDVCEMCGAMYPRGRKVVQVKPINRTKAKPKAAVKKKKK